MMKGARTFKIAVLISALIVLATDGVPLNITLNNIDGSHSPKRTSPNIFESHDDLEQAIQASAQHDDVIDGLRVFSKNGVNHIRSTETRVTAPDPQGLNPLSGHPEDEQILSELNDLQENHYQEFRLSPKVVFFVETFQGGEVILEADATDLIENLKAMIFEKEGIPPELQRLSYAGNQLDGSRSLSDYNIQKGSTLKLELTPSATAKAEYTVATACDIADATCQNGQQQEIETCLDPQCLNKQDAQDREPCQGKEQCEQAFDAAVVSKQLEIEVNPKGDNQNSEDPISDALTPTTSLAYTHGRGLTIASVAPGNCLGPTTNFNLLNNGVNAIQSNGVSGKNTNANQGCDGLIQKNFPTDNTARIVTVRGSPEPGPYNWVAQFPFPVRVQAILYIERKFTEVVQFRVGNLSTNSYLDNPQCIGGQLTAGGWLDCQRTGRYLALTSTSEFQFMEVMAFSQEPIHIRAISATLSSTLTTAANFRCTTGTNCQASNALRSTLVVWNSTPGSTSCCIYSDDQTDPEFRMKIAADVLVDCVLLTPSDQEATPVSDWQKNVEVWISNSADESFLCGKVPNYNEYTEVACNRVGNQIIVKRPGPSKHLAMGGVSILSSCDCSKSTFNPALISLSAKPFASATTVNIKPTDPPVTISFNTQMPDTVSSVCGPADGLSKCGSGQRVIVFTDKLTGQLVTFPYKEFTWDAASSQLTLNPAKANGTCVLTATLKLADYPTVSYAQDITSISTSSAPFMISNKKLNVTIGQEAVFPLPENANYTIVNDPQSLAKIDGNKLFVKSDSSRDVGVYSLKICASTSGQSGNFTVKVNFQAAPSNSAIESSKPAVAANITETQNAAVNATSAEDSLISVEDSENLLDTVECSTNEEPISCVTDGFQYFLDQQKGVLVQDRPQVDSQSTIKQPTYKVSKVVPKGIFSIKFSEDMTLEGFKNSTFERENGTAETADRYKYTLSPRHLDLTIKSENTTQPKFYWFAQNITSTKIEIQLVFEDPLYISIDPNLQDKLTITILPPALKSMKSLATGMLAVNPLGTFVRNLPPQVIPGQAIELVSSAADSMEDLGQYSVLANVAIQFIVSGSLAQMWSMVNSLQIVNSFNLLKTNMPGNVLLVMNNLSSMIQVSAIPTSMINSAIFNFTATGSPGFAFERAGNDSKVVVHFLGTFFYCTVLTLLLYVMYGFAHLVGKYSKRCKKIVDWCYSKLFFNLVLTLQLESSLDFGLGVLLRFEEPYFNTPSDFFDFGFSVFAVFCLLVLPVIEIVCLSKNIDKMDDPRFESKWGSLYEGYKKSNHEQRKTAIQMLGLFLVRRALTSLNLVELREQTVWMQVTANMLLSFFDVCVMITWSPFDKKTRSVMEKFNGVVVLLLSQLCYMQTDLIPRVEDRYFIGWWFIGVLGVMFLANLVVVLLVAFKGVAAKSKKCIYKSRQAKAQQKLQLKKKNLVAARVKPFNRLAQGVVLDDGPMMSERATLKLQILVEKRKSKADLVKIERLRQRLAALNDQQDERGPAVLTQEKPETAVQTIKQQEPLAAIQELDEISSLELRSAQEDNSNQSDSKGSDWQSSSSLADSQPLSFRSQSIQSQTQTQEQGSLVRGENFVAVEEEVRREHEQVQAIFQQAHQVLQGFADSETSQLRPEPVVSNNAADSYAPQERSDLIPNEIMSLEQQQDEVRIVVASGPSLGGNWRRIDLEDQFGLNRQFAKEELERELDSFHRSEMIQKRSQSQAGQNEMKISNYDELDARLSAKEDQYLKMVKRLDQSQHKRK